MTAMVYACEFSSQLRVKATAADCPPPSHGLSIREPTARRTSPMRCTTLRDSYAEALFRCGHDCASGGESTLRSSRVSRSVFRHVLDDAHRFDGRVQRVGCRADGIDHGVPSGVRGDSCVLARDPRGLSGLSQPHTSNSFERLAMMITTLTRFLSESPERFPLRLPASAPCGLSVAHGPRRYHRAQDRPAASSTGHDAREMS